MYGTDDIIDADGNLTGQFSGRTVGGICRVANNASLVNQRADSALSGQSEHTVLMGLAGEENARVAMDADGVVMHGPGGDSGFNIMLAPPVLATVAWDPPPIATLRSATHVVRVVGARKGGLCTVSHEGVYGVEAAASLMLSAQVTAADEVTVLALNAGLVTVDLAAGALRVLVAHASNL